MAKGNRRATVPSPADVLLRGVFRRGRVRYEFPVGHGGTLRARDGRMPSAGAPIGPLSNQENCFVESTDGTGA